MLWQPVGENIIVQSIQRARVEFERSEKREIERRKEFYDGKLKAHVVQRIRELFTNQDEANELVKLSSRTMNVMKYIVNSIATLYDFGVDRKWLLDKAVVDEETGRKQMYDTDTGETYARIMEKADADQTLRTVQRMTVLCHDCILRYAYTARGHMLYPMTRDMCDVIQDANDPRIAIGIIWYVSRTQTPAFGGAESIDCEWHYMDAHVHNTYDKSGKQKTTEPNPYAALNSQVETYDGNGMFAPFIDFHDEPRFSTFWRENMDEVLVEAAIEACVWLSYLNGQLKYSTFKQAWKAAAMQGTGTGVSQQSRNIEGGFTRVINVGANGQMGLLDYTVMLDNTLATLRDKLNLFGMTIGLGENAFQINASPESGVAIRLRADSLEERQSREAITYNRKERSLARIIKFAAGAAPAGAGFDPYPEEERIDPSADPSKMRVDFADVTKKGMDAEQREYWKWKLDAGLATAAQFLMAENPDLNEDEAQRQADEALADSIKRKGSQTNASIFGSAPRVATLSREVKNGNLSSGANKEQGGDDADDDPDADAVDDNEGAEQT